MLYAYINYLRQRNIPIKRAPYYLKKLIFYSFNARIIALFLINILGKYNIKKVGKVEDYIRNLTP